jgi:enamine deaminase RidA (YjgF/YER057c/UK114 family)
VRMGQRKLRTASRLAAFLFFSTLIAQAEIRAVTSQQAKTDQFSSPAVDGGDYVYISGQGPQGHNGKVPATFDEQVRQTLDNI